MSEGLGLIVSPDHEETINGFDQVPMLFCAGTYDGPDEWIPDLYVEIQQRTNACAGHMEALMCSHSNLVQTGECIRFSRKFAYLTAQLEGGFSGSDQGTSIHSTIVAATKYGCCTEATFPLDWDGPEDYRTGWTSEAQREAYLHRHHGDTQYDLRDWDTMIAWVQDRRPFAMGTTWYSSQDSMGWVEDVSNAFGGQFRGLHARTGIGFTKVGGIFCPVIQNSHGRRHGRNGRTVVTRDLWDGRWRRDPRFCAFGFNRIDEVEPARRSYSNLKPGDVC